MPKPFRIEPLCQLAPVLARTHLVVRPFVALLHADQQQQPPSSASSSSSSTPLVEDSMIPRLDAREVAAVFSAPFYNFLKTSDLPPRPGQTLPSGPWYEGAWIQWKDAPWKVHNFYVPVNNQKVSKPRPTSSTATGGAQDNNEEARLGSQPDADVGREGRFKVWGMTGRVLVDAARVAFGEEPEMEHNPDFGDGVFIKFAQDEGAFSEEASEPLNKEGKEGHEAAKM